MTDRVGGGKYGVVLKRILPHVTKDLNLADEETLAGLLMFFSQAMHYVVTGDESIRTEIAATTDGDEDVQLLLDSVDTPAIVIVEGDVASDLS